MRNRFRAALKAADFKLYLTIPHTAWRKPWNVDARPVGSGAKAFEYIARYVQKTALDSARILEVTAHGVTIAWTDRESGQPRTTSAHRRSLPPPVPPTRAAARVRAPAPLRLFERRRARSLPAPARAPARRRGATASCPTPPARCCPGCGADAMQFLFGLRPGQSRAPPLLSS